MKKKLLLISAFLCASFTAHAAVQVDSWTAAANTWTYDAQPDYASTLTINADGDSTATLTSSLAPGGYPSNHLVDGVFYSFMSQPTLTGSINSVLPDIQLLTIEVVFVGTLSETSFSLDFNDSYTGLAADTFSSFNLPDPVDTPIGQFEATQYTYTWNVSDFGGTSEFDFAFGLHSHAAIIDIVVTQSAVPEPSTYALMFGGVALAVCIYRRRKTA